MNRFGILKPLLAAIALVAAPSLAPAALVFSDDFSGPNGNLVGTTPDIGGVWAQTGATATNPIQVASNAAAVGNTGQDVYAPLSLIAPAAVGNITTMLDINVSAAGTGDYFSHLSSPAGTTTNFYQRLQARSSGNGYQLGLVDTSGTGNTITWGTDVLNFGQTYRVGVTWNFVPGLNNDTFAVTVGGPTYLTHSWTSATLEPLTLDAVNLRQGGGAASAPTLTVDNLTVNFIPEPATLALTSLVGLAGLGLRRRK
jgi:hypothetical protein